jgi:ankyrin repeat protein
MHALDASREGHEQIIRLLLERKDVDVNAQDFYRRTSLIYAAWYNRVGAAKILLNSKTVNVNSRDNDGQTSLLWAVDNGNADLVKVSDFSG